MDKFLEENNIECPEIKYVSGIKKYGSYNELSDTIKIDKEYIMKNNKSTNDSLVDTTEFAVLAHEIGHFYYNILGKPKLPEYITLNSFVTNESELFAECFRLFVDNPAFLKSSSLKLYNFMLNSGLKEVANA